MRRREYMSPRAQTPMHSLQYLATTIRLAAIRGPTRKGRKELFSRVQQIFLNGNTNLH
jgi:hypothetical protein